MNTAHTHHRRDIKRAIEQSTREHAQVLASARGIEALVEASVSPAPGDVARQLRSFGDQLSAHFAEEEQEALYSWVADECPWLALDIERTRQQHPRLVVSFRQLATEAGSAHEVGFATELGVRIRAAIASFRKHEADESRLLLVALRRDQQAG